VRAEIDARDDRTGVGEGDVVHQPVEQPSRIGMFAEPGRCVLAVQRVERGLAGLDRVRPRAPWPPHPVLANHFGGDAHVPRPIAPQPVAQRRLPKHAVVFLREQTDAGQRAQDAIVSADGAIPPGAPVQVLKYVAISSEKVRQAGIDVSQVYTNEFVTNK
jgi:hypothetical protein